MTKIQFTYQVAPRRVVFRYHDGASREFMMSDHRRVRLGALGITRRFRVAYRKLLKLCWRIHPMDSSGSLDQMYLDPQMFSLLDRMMISGMDGLQFNA